MDNSTLENVMTLGVARMCGQVRPQKSRAVIFSSAQKMSSLSEVRYFDLLI